MLELAFFSGRSTLLDLRYLKHIRADRGNNGQGKDKYGRGGRDKVVRVPVGTQVFDAESGEQLGDVTEHKQSLVIAKGGRGGLGNIHFATPVDRAPRKATPGEPGVSRSLRLELKVLADVGLLGFPNVGKSTFVATVSAARPKIADYPFTTLTPSLGVVSVGGGPSGDGTSFVVADIPGLIAGASAGAGLGHRFLRHVERTRVLLHFVTLDPADDREPLTDYQTLRRELEAFDPELAKRPEIVVLSKADLSDVQESHSELAARFSAELGIELRLISAASRQGLEKLVADLAAVVSRSRAGDDGAA